MSAIISLLAALGQLEDAAEVPQRRGRSCGSQEHRSIMVASRTAMRLRCFGLCFVGFGLGTLVTTLTFDVRLLVQVRLKKRTSSGRTVTLRLRQQAPTRLEPLLQQDGHDGACQNGYNHVRDVVRASTGHANHLLSLGCTFCITMGPRPTWAVHCI